MKTYKNKLNAVEQFQKELIKNIEIYYRQQLAENTKVALQRAKKLSTKDSLQCKAV